MRPDRPETPPTFSHAPAVQLHYVTQHPHLPVRPTRWRWFTLKLRSEPIGERAANTLCVRLWTCSFQTSAETERLLPPRVTKARKKNMSPLACVDSGH